MKKSNVSEKLELLIKQLEHQLHMTEQLNLWCTNDYSQGQKDGIRLAIDLMRMFKDKEDK